jgi:hypothetical protein
MKITIITSCTRPENLPKLYESIQFEHVKKWIIVYDTSKRQEYTWSYKKYSEIIEAECPHQGVLGYAQKNFGLKFVKGGMVYFLDDDTIMHPNFWKFIPMMNEDTVYLWDQESHLYIPESGFGTFTEIDANLAAQKRSENPSILKSDIIHCATIHLGMYIVPYKYINIDFISHVYLSAGIFITNIYEEDPSKCSYIPYVLSYGKLIC